MRTRQQIRFRVWGVDLDPEALTASTGVRPSHRFKVGESRGRAASKVAGWEWHSDWSGPDSEPLFGEMLALLQPHQDYLQQVVAAGSQIGVTLVGEVKADLIETEEAADAKGWHGGKGSDFAPFLASDRPVIWLDEMTLAFFYAVGASFGAHLDFDLDVEDLD